MQLCQLWRVKLLPNLTRSLRWKTTRKVSRSWKDQSATWHKLHTYWVFSHFRTPSSWSSFSFATQVGTMTYPDFFHSSRQQLSEWESSHDWWLAEILPEVPNMSGNWRSVNYDLQSPKLTVCTCQEAFPKGKDPLQNQSFSGAVGEFTQMISLKFLQVVSWFTSSLAKAEVWLSSSFRLAGVWVGAWSSLFVGKPLAYLVHHEGCRHLTERKKTVT